MTDTYTTGGGLIRDEAHLRTLPDGTIITWLRDPGDRTSEAVAFVRREVTGSAQNVAVWVSSGDWSESLDRLNYPCRVVRLGEFVADHYLGAELPVLGETLTAISSGGIVSREKALECASRWLAGAENAIRVTEVAEHFEKWLDRPYEDEDDDLDGLPVYDMDADR